MIPVDRSIFFSAVERYGSLALLLVSAADLLRLLTPREFGIYAVIIAVSQEFGGANYLIQKRSLSRRNIRTALHAALGLGLAGASTAICWLLSFLLIGPPYCHGYNWRAGRLIRLPGSQAGQPNKI
jgi:hypothetical protein